MGCGERVEDGGGGAHLRKTGSGVDMPDVAHVRCVGVQLPKCAHPPLGVDASHTSLGLKHEHIM